MTTTAPAPSDLDARAAAWLARERARGLLDVKLFPRVPGDPAVSEDAALAAFLDQMEARERGEGVAIIGQRL